MNSKPTLCQERDSANESDEDEAPRFPGPVKAVSFSSKYTVNQVFTMQQENELAKYLAKCANLSYGLSYRQVRILAYDYANIIPDVRCQKPGKQTR